MSERVVLISGQQFDIVDQIPLYRGISEPVQFERCAYTFVAWSTQQHHQVFVVHSTENGGLEQDEVDEIEGCLVWRRDTQMIRLISIPQNLTATRRWLARALIRSAPTLDTLQFIISALNKTPVEEWPCDE